MFNIFKIKIRNRKQTIEINNYKKEEIPIQLELINSNVYDVPDYRYTFIILGLKYPKNMDDKDFFKFLSSFDCKKIFDFSDEKYHTALIIGNSQQIFSAINNELFYDSDIINKFKDILYQFPESYFRFATKYRLLESGQFLEMNDSKPRPIPGLLCNYDDPEIIKEKLIKFGIDIETKEEILYKCCSISFDPSLDKNETYSIYDYINKRPKDEYYDKLKENNVITDHMEFVCVPTYQKVVDQEIQNDEKEEYYEGVDEVVEVIDKTKSE